MQQPAFELDFHDRASPRVRTATGFICGATDDRAQTALHVFKGIPYAAAPTGSLRWRPPQPVQPWPGTRSALEFGADCPQQQPAPDTRAPGMSEDCLYLNIWTPACADPGTLPVMVWIHGGSFVSGSGSQACCDGAALAREGVVLVTINYRLGLFGFLAHPALSAESPHGASGNYGLLDQLSALHWIQANIAGFGGDPGRVTLFGVSAGSASISLLLASTLADGLFHQAILQSPGSGRPLASLGHAESVGASLGGIAALRDLSSSAVQAMTSRLSPGVRSLTEPRVLRPIQDGYVITEDERTALKLGRLRAMPIIVGGNADEGTRLTQDWPLTTVAQYRTLLKNNFSGSPCLLDALYPVEHDKDVPARVAEIFSDAQFNYGVRLLAQAMSSRKVPVWRYQFLRRRPGQTDGPHHADEVAYVFGNLDAAGAGGGTANVDETDRVLSLAMMNAWVAFADAGDPNCPALPDWPVYVQSLDCFLAFDDPIRLGHDWRKPQLDFLDAYYDRRQT